MSTSFGSGRIDMEHAGVGDLSQDVQQMGLGRNRFNNAGMTGNLGFEASARNVLREGNLASAHNQSTRLPKEGVFASNPEVPQMQRGGPSLMRRGPGRHGNVGTAQFLADIPPADLDTAAPRRLDLGALGRDAVPGLSNHYRTFNAVNGENAMPSFGRIVAPKMPGQKTGSNRVGSMQGLAVRAMGPDSHELYQDGKHGAGSSGVDAVKTGEYTCPYTGKVYDTYEDEYRPPDGDFRKSESGSQRVFDQLHGGFGPSAVRRTPQDLLPTDEPVPDVPLDDPHEKGRTIMLEKAKIQDLLGPHKDERAHVDADGYEFRAERRGVGMHGLNEGPRVLPRPSMNLWGGTRAEAIRGSGVNTVGAGMKRPAVFTIKKQGTTLGSLKNSGVQSLAEQGRTMIAGAHLVTRDNRTEGPMGRLGYNAGGAVSQGRLENATHAAPQRGDNLVAAPGRFTHNVTPGSYAGMQKPSHLGGGDRKTVMPVMDHGRVRGSMVQAGLQSGMAKPEHLGAGQRKTALPVLDHGRVRGSMVQAELGTGMREVGAIGERANNRTDFVNPYFLSHSRLVDGAGTAIRGDIGVDTHVVTGRGHVFGRAANPSAGAVGLSATASRPLHVKADQRPKKTPTLVNNRQAGIDFSDMRFRATSPNFAAAAAENQEEVKELVSISPMNDPFRF